MSDELDRAKGGGRATTSILLTLAVVGVIAYLITIVVARGLGPADYAVFSVFWAALYVAIGSLAGLQQELTRASTPTDEMHHGGRVIAQFALGASILAMLATALVGVVGSVLAPGVLGELVLPFALGVGFYGAVATYTGVAYGARAWATVIVVMLSDVGLRLMGILVALGLELGVVGVAWASVIPIPLTLVVLLVSRRLRISNVGLDVRGRALVLNALQAIGGALAVSLLVNGLPIAIALGRRDSSAAEVGVLVFALTVTRAPLVVTVLALQSLLIVQFKGGRAATTRRLVGLLLAVGFVLSVLAWLVGPQALAVIARESFAIPGWLLGALVLASMTTALLAVSGALALSRSQHRLYVIGWAVASLGSFALFALPGPLEVRVLIALSGGPLLGLVVHGGASLFSRRQPGARAETVVADDVNRGAGGHRS